MNEISSHILGLVRDNPAAQKVTELLSPFGDVYVVGGAVRDTVLKKKPKDIDIVAQVDEDTIESVLGNYDKASLKKTGKQFPVFRFNYGGEEVEIALPRTETKVGEGNKDWVIRTDPNISIERDLERRDFTANAIAVNAKTGEIIDPLNGIEDIEKGKLKVISDSSFKDDSSRTVRALTAMSKHGLQPDEDTRNKMKEHAHHIQKVSPEILGSELDKIVEGHHPHDAFKTGHETGVLEHLLPEVHGTFGFDQKNPHHNLDLGSHLMEVLKNMSHLSSDSDMRIAALLHDIGKPGSMWEDENGIGHFYQGPNGEGANHEEVGAEMAEEILRRLRFPANRIARIKHMIQNHMFAEFNTPKGARKFLNQAGSYEAANDLLDLREADHMGKGKDTATRAMADKMRSFVDEENNANNAFSPKDLAINGNDIIKTLGMSSGPEVGNIIKHLTEMVINSPSINTRDNLIGIVKSFYGNPPSTVQEGSERLSSMIMKMSAWRDIEMKAKRLKDNGDVNITTNSPNGIIATVKGDTGTYECEIYREDPNSMRITHWNCSCPWGHYAWGRTRIWKKFEGRPCSHTMATFWMSRSTPIGYTGEEIPEGTTYTAEPDQAQADIANQTLDQIGTPPETPEKQLTPEEEEWLKSLEEEQPIPGNVPATPTAFPEDLPKESKWKRIP